MIPPDAVLREVFLGSELKGRALYSQLTSFEETDREYQDFEDLHKLDSGHLPALNENDSGVSQWNVEPGRFLWVDVRSIEKSLKHDAVFSHYEPPDSIIHETNAPLGSGSGVPTPAISAATLIGQTKVPPAWPAELSPSNAPKLRSRCRRAE